jgi:peptide/nickel transport system permease protein
VGAAATTLLLASLAIFAILHAIPGDPAAVLAGPDATAATVASVRGRLGLDRPLPVQYAEWLGDAVQGQFGRSYVFGVGVGGLLANGLANTAMLALSALTIAVPLALALSVSVVLWPRRGYAALVGAFEVVTVAVPAFVSGVLLVRLFAVVWPILPAGGPPPAGYLGRPDLTAQYLLLPAVCLALPVASTLTRFLAASLRAELARPYVLTARAAGVSRYRLVVHVALRNALVPVIPVLGIQIGQLVGSAVLIEAIFAWPGVGELLAEGIRARDYPIVQAVLLVAVAAFILTRLAADLLEELLDPTRGAR